MLSILHANIVFDAVLPSHAQSLATNDNKHAAFQLYVAVPHTAVAPLPSSISFAQGCVLPLAVSTAAAGLYQSGFLELPLPSPTSASANEGKILLVWGGSSSVGSAAIQLASASGLTVFTTASPSNFDFVKSLGAAQVFDHSKHDVVQQIVDALKGATLVGVYDAISLADTVTKSAEILKAALGKGFIATVLPPPENLPDGIEASGGKCFVLRSLWLEA
jgi:NADPH:quinone reductase-like Zn-dependent oxidoreductase